MMSLPTSMSNGPHASRMAFSSVLEPQSNWQAVTFTDCSARSSFWTWLDSARLVTRLGRPWLKRLGWTAPGSVSAAAWPPGSP